MHFRKLVPSCFLSQDFHPFCSSTVLSTASLFLSLKPSNQLPHVFLIACCTKVLFRINDQCNWARSLFYHRLFSSIRLSASSE
ncbi:hypothetical protein CW304_17580 [Bacillus sp. UFRGS-B20]|nr:hypothetical protein CW304_17580 [Bacillus sp. UFRGS-B20]